jgi:hypothetical protein
MFRSFPGIDVVQRDFPGLSREDGQGIFVIIISGWGAK